MSIRISDGGGLAGFGSIEIPEDKAKVLFDALAELYGCRVEQSWYEELDETSVGSITVKRT